MSAPTSMSEMMARIIDPEAFGLPPHPRGEFGLSDRDEAREKADAILALLLEPTEGMLDAAALSLGFAEMTLKAGPMARAYTAREVAAFVLRYAIGAAREGKCSG